MYSVYQCIQKPTSPFILISSKSSAAKQGQYFQYFDYTYMYFWSCERAANIHTYAYVSYPLISSEICSKNKIFLC